MSCHRSVKISPHHGSLTVQSCRHTHGSVSLALGKGDVVLLAVQERLRAVTVGFGRTVIS
jgi:hypothetical protein